MLVLFPISGGRYAVLCLELPEKVIGVRKAGFLGYLGDAQLGFQQQTLRLLQAFVVQIAENGHAKLAAEVFGQCHRAAMQVQTQLGQRDFVGIILPDVFLGQLPQRFLREKQQIIGLDVLGKYIQRAQIGFPLLLGETREPVYVFGKRFGISKLGVNGTDPFHDPLVLFGLCQQALSHHQVSEEQLSLVNRSHGLQQAERALIAVYFLSLRCLSEADYIRGGTKLGAFFRK